jgi:hypothetical protein
VALGLAQRPDWPPVEQVRVLDYTPRQQTGDRVYPTADLPADTVAPDMILYLLAPHQPLVRDEVPYLRDLLRQHGGDRVVYVLNLTMTPLAVGLRQSRTWPTRGRDSPTATTGLSALPSTRAGWSTSTAGGGPASPNCWQQYGPRSARTGRSRSSR